MAQSVVERVQRYKQRMLARGMTQVRVWVPREKAEEIRRLAVAMRGDDQEDSS